MSNLQIFMKFELGFEIKKKKRLFDILNWLKFKFNVKYFYFVIFYAKPSTAWVNDC